MNKSAAVNSITDHTGPSTPFLLQITSQNVQRPSQKDRWPKIINHLSGAQTFTDPDYHLAFRDDGSIGAAELYRLDCLQEAPTRSTEIFDSTPSVTFPRCQILGEPSNLTKIFVHDPNSFHFLEAYDIDPTSHPSLHNRVTILKFQPHASCRKFLLVNVYAPQEQAESPFFAELLDLLREIDVTSNVNDWFHFIITGDFNCVLNNDRNDVSKLYAAGHPITHQASLCLQLMTTLHLEDVFLAKLTTTAFSTSPYTNSMSSRLTDEEPSTASTSRQRRLDRFLASEEVLTEFHTRYQKTRRRIPGSTHHGINLQIATIPLSCFTTEVAIGPPRFTTDDSLLKKLPGLKETMRITRHDVESFLSAHSAAFVEVYKTYCSVYDGRSSFEDIIKNPLESQNQCAEIAQIFDLTMHHFGLFLQRETKNVKSAIAQGTIPLNIAAVAPSRDSSELPLSVANQKILAKSQMKRTMITKLQNDTGVTTTDREQIKAIGNDFYAKLFNLPNAIDDHTFDAEAATYLSRFGEKRGLQDEETIAALAKPFEKEELLRILRLYSKKETSPGVDGISYRYYSLSQEALNPLLLQLLNLMGTHQFLPEHMQTVLIKLLPKKKDKSQLKNWRPISLMNSVTKLLAALVN